MYGSPTLASISSPLTLSPAMGLMTLYKTSRPDSSLFSGITVSFGLPYFTISVALNVLLTVIIAWRLLLHSRNFEKLVGSTSAITSLCRSIVTMLIESSALYAIVSLCFIVPYAMSNYVSAIFLPMLSRVQIIAPLLIIRRVATRRALTASKMASGASSVRFQGTGGTGTRSYPPNPIIGAERAGVNIMTTIEFADDMDDHQSTLRSDQKV